METTNKKAIVLLSGGIDSAVCVALAQEEKRDVTALFFDYGQRQISQERIAVLALVEHFEVELHEITLDMAFLKTYSKSMLNPTVAIDAESIVIPCRNLLLLSHALAVADTIDAREIWIGVNTHDYPIWPDCGIDFLHTFEALTYLTTRKSTVKIRVPFYAMSKKLLVKFARTLNVPLKDTWSCYDPKVDAPCGVCPACKLRKGAEVNDD